MHRIEVINTLIKKYNFNNYLEIGVNDGQVFDKIEAKNKLGVDPDCDTYKISWHGKGMMFCDTSDNFFNQLDSNIKFDIIFIDGDHEREQVFRDITNSIKHLEKNGVIVVHDCSPANEKNTMESQRYGIWNGTVYLGLIDAVKTYNLNYYTVNTDWGCAILFPLNINLNSPRYRSSISWEDFDKNRIEILNLINIDKFKELLSL